MADKYVENILKLWDLECLIPNFKEGDIDSISFKYLDNSLLSGLIPRKDLKMMFKSKYEQYKNQVLAGVNFNEIKSEEIDLTIEDAKGSQSKPESQSPSFDIEFILQESLAGRDIIKSYDAVGRLDYDLSLSLVNILIYYLISQSDDFSIDKEVLNEIADAIITRFPNEKKKRYYYCVGEQMKGALVDCYLNIRRRLRRKEKQKRKEKSIAENSVNDDNGPSQKKNSERMPMPEWVNVTANNEETINIKWVSHVDSLLQGLPLLLANEKFVDTTIICEGQSIKCHKIVLCCCSSYFETILDSTPSKHPVVVLADVEFWEIQAIINFMYMGELDIENHKLPQLLEIAEKLKVKGLSNANVNDHEQDINIIETANVDTEFCNDQVVKDPLSFSPIASSRRKRKQDFNNLVEPLVSFPPITSNEDLLFKKKIKDFVNTEGTSFEVDEECITEDFGYKPATIVQERTRKKIKLGEFRPNLIQQHQEEFTPQQSLPTRVRRPKEPVPSRLSARHFPVLIPSTEKKENPRRACYVCKWTTVEQPRRKDTKWMCHDCDVPLCVPECFHSFHTKTNY